MIILKNIFTKHILNYYIMVIFTGWWSPSVTTTSLQPLYHSFSFLGVFVVHFTAD